MSTARQPQGIPAGGQFAATNHSESGIALAAPERTAQDLRAGDRFPYHRGDTIHTVEVLRSPEPHTDVTGLPVLKIWGRTGGRDGWLILGPQAPTPACDAAPSELHGEDGR